jgi:amino acid efflux transporter
VGVAYLALQWVTIGVLGDTAGEGSVPLLTLVNQTAPKAGAIIIASIAAIVSLGVLNAYLAAIGKLGASLGRDGDLPRYFAKGAEPDVIPRRSLMLSLVISVVFFAILFVQDFQLLSLIPIHLSSMVAIYVLGMAAAVLIFPRWSFDWWIAVIALAMTILLLVLNGPNVLFPATVVIVSLGVTLVKRRLKAQKARQSR